MPAGLNMEALQKFILRSNATALGPKQEIRKALKQISFVQEAFMYREREAISFINSVALLSKNPAEQKMLKTGFWKLVSEILSEIKNQCKKR